MNLLSVSAIQLRRTLRRTSSRIFAQLILLLAGSPKYESDRKKGFQFNLSKNCFILTCMCKSSSSASLPRVFIKGMFTLSANLGVITGCTNGFWNQYIKNGTFCISLIQNPILFHLLLLSIPMKWNLITSDGSRKFIMSGQNFLIYKY